jgi:hypothetical protein
VRRETLDQLDHFLRLDRLGQTAVHAGIHAAIVDGTEGRSRPFFDARPGVYAG